MKTFLIVLGFAVLVYTFTVLTGSSTSAYNTNIDITRDGIPAFSYEDATTVAESLR